MAGVRSEEYTNVKSIQISADRTTLAVGEKIKAKVTLVPSKAKKALLGQVKKARFASSNPYVAKVTSSRRIVAAGKGSCTIYAYAENGRSAKIRIKVQ